MWEMIVVKHFATMLGVVSLSNGNRLVVTWPLALHTTVPTFPVWNLGPGNLLIWLCLFYHQHSNM